MDNTLDEDVWMDSFDKLLKPRPVLRELKIIRKGVRASFNLDSSVENCKSDDSCVAKNIVPVSAAPVTHITSKRHATTTGKTNARKKHKTAKESMMSTPVANNTLSKKPFRCSISPVGEWILEHFAKRQENSADHVDDGCNFNSTPINSNAATVDFGSNREAAVASADENLSPHFSPLTLLSRRPSNKINLRKRSKRHIFFESVAMNAAKEKRNTATHCQPQEVQGSLKQQKERPTSLTILPGKWRKSLNILRQSRQQPIHCRRSSRRHRGTTLGEASVEFVAISKIIGERKSIYIKSELRRSEGPQDWRLRVLQQCQQQAYLPFEEVYVAESMLQCRKIGEGVYGEVFMYAATQQQEDCGDTVIKIIPIEGTLQVNGEVQKNFEQILPEIVISRELSALRETFNENSTSGFVDIIKVACVKGKYPQHLVKLWEEYDEIKKSENDHPDVFTRRQLYIVLELGYGGRDLETFEFKNAEQAYYALLQIILTLAVGEEAYQFEHRDLHWGNVLILNTKVKSLEYKLSGREITIPTKGVQITIIDYTLSRMSVNDFCYYNDLANDDDLFSATGDYQYDIYRMMRDVLKNNWATYEPKTNVFWISYVLDKMIKGVVYKNARSKLHSTYMRRLEELKQSVLGFQSAGEWCASHLHSIKQT